VPICFPWFGPKPDAPVHGVARLVEWAVARVDTADTGLRATLELQSDDYTRRHFDGSFRLELAVAVGRTLTLDLSVHNTGRAPFRFEEALHTYFAVADVRRVTVRGLEGASYVDKTDGGARKTLGPEPLAFTRETDRVFPGSSGPLTIVDPAWDRRLTVRRSGSRTAVVWNPWLAKARAMADFGDDEWPEMVCVESANALDDAIVLDPGGRHDLSTTIEVERGR
jgi:glucose-6-phosphate 1-epimerase